MNRTRSVLQFAVGLVIAIAVALAFFIGTEKPWPVVALIVGIGLIATSGTRLGGRI